MKRLAMVVLLFVAQGLPAQSASRGLTFFPLVPCRAVDAQVFHGTPLPVTLRNVCGIPQSARAVSLMLTISAPTADGSYTLDTFPAVQFVAGETISSCGTVWTVETGEKEKQAEFLRSSGRRHLAETVVNGTAIGCGRGRK